MTLTQVNIGKKNSKENIETKMILHSSKREWTEDTFIIFSLYLLELSVTCMGEIPWKAVLSTEVIYDRGYNEIFQRYNVR